MSECLACDGITTVTVDAADGSELLVDIDCCTEMVLQWYKGYEDGFVVDRAAQWADGGVWLDDAQFWDAPEFEVSISCVPLGLAGACWYTTADGAAYATGNGLLYWSCDE